MGLVLRREDCSQAAGGLVLCSMVIPFGGGTSGSPPLSSSPAQASSGSPAQNPRKALPASSSSSGRDTLTSSPLALSKARVDGRGLAGASSCASAWGRAGEGGVRSHFPNMRCLRAWAGEMMARTLRWATASAVGRATQPRQLVCNHGSETVTMVTMVMVLQKGDGADPSKIKREASGP